MRPGSNHGTKERGTAGPPQGKAGTASARREKEEITLYCILVNWRGSKRASEGGDGEEIGAAAPSGIPEKRTPARPAHFFPSFTPRKVEIT